MGTNGAGAILRFENVSVTFPGDAEPALKNVSFQVPSGETRIVFGAAGSGKSVMLKVALGLIRPDSGHVYVFGRDITRMREEELFEIRSQIGVLFQEGGLFDSLTVLENVGYPLLNRKGARVRDPNQRSEIEKKVREALSFVELEHTLDKLPSQLSGGMRRRVGIARAGVTHPPLVLYDSPTAGLDPITANNILSLIVKSRDISNTTSVIVTHRHQDGQILANFRYNRESNSLEPLSPADEEVRRRTRFIVFREGRLVFEGMQEELQATTDPYVAKFKSMRS